jgi:DNA-binding MarR family transcriptional regulator
MLDAFTPEPSSQRDPPNRPNEHSVRAILKARRDREKYFSADLFADPAWDMLLELYATALGQRRISVSSLCMGSGVPATTALRWITALEKRQLIIRRDDPLDGRRVFVELSQGGLNAMHAYFETSQPTIS